MPNQKALDLPDALLVRYFRDGHIDDITDVSTLEDGRICVEIRTEGESRVQCWRDLGGGLGFVPDVE